MSNDQSMQRQAQPPDEELKAHGDQLGEAVKKVADPEHKKSDEAQAPADKGGNS